MCYYCYYLTHIQSSSLPTIYDDNQRIPIHFKRHPTRLYCFNVPLYLISLTLFFVTLNTTLVLSQPPRAQQQERSSSQILIENPKSKKEITTS